MRLAATARRLDWRLPFATAFLASAPVAANIGSAPGWVNGAWQVSAVLLGFVIALVVFLLQAAGGRNLRAEQTYRALVFESLVAWPVAFALAFLAWAAVVERFSVPTHQAASSAPLGYGGVCGLGVNLGGGVAVVEGGQDAFCVWAVGQSVGACAGAVGGVRRRDVRADGA
jgi:hypothetical protein